MDSQKIDLVIPASIDQIKARQENELLDANKFTPVDPQDDDIAHMYEHAMAKNTPQKWAHYFIHEKHNGIKKKMAEEKAKQAAAQGGGQNGADPTQQNNQKPNVPPQGAKPPAVAMSRRTLRFRRINRAPNKVSSSGG